MSKAGKTVLLSLLLLVGIGATPQIHAQEIPVKTALVKKAERVCTPLQNYLLTNTVTCKDLLTFQKDQAKIAQALEEEKSEFAGYSYTVEPTYYVEPQITPPLTTLEEPTTIPTQTPQNGIPMESAGLDSNLILSIINSHRASIGKPAFSTDPNLCSLAQARSIELAGEFANGTLHSGLYNRNLPYWITEDTKWGSNEAGTVQWWLNSPVHRKAIEGDYAYSCGACQGSACAQLFTSYTPKGGIAVANHTPTPTGQAPLTSSLDNIQN